MNNRAIFAVSILMSTAAFGMFSVLYLVPTLKTMGVVEALQVLILIHAYRFIGLAFLLPGVVAAELPPEFAMPAAYGDLTAAIMAIISVLMLHAHVAGAMLFAWVFNIWGTADLLNAMFQGVRRIDSDPKGPGILGAAFFIPTVVVPALLITHGLIFWQLLRGAL